MQNQQHPIKAPAPTGTPCDPDHVIFLPGMLADARLWKAMLDQYRQIAGARPITPHFPDVTRSDSIAEMAETVLATAPARFALVGMSMGGYVAFEICRQVPDRISHLMLVNTQATADTDRARRRRLLLARIGGGGGDTGHHRTRPFQGTTPALLDQMLHPATPRDGEIAKLIAAMAEAGGAETYRRQQTAVAHRPDSRESLGHLAMPVAIVGGAADGVTLPEKHQEMAALITGASLNMVEKAGHYVPLEAPDILAAELDGLLRRTSHG